jgi:predicted SnoaL-like aldol condensation-catalyzing enzyme
MSVIKEQPAQANKALVKSFVEQVLNKHNVTAVDKYYAPDLIQHSPSMGQGRQGFKQFFTPFFSAFPDIHVTIEHIIA